MNNIKQRNSNIELLRIVAMFLILIVHADYLSLGKPNIQSLDNNAIETFLKQFIESLSIVCVNVFVLISGWFSISFTLKKIVGFIFQCVFILTLIYIATIYFGLTTFSFEGVKNCFLLTPDGWFIRAYLFLSILSPVLNEFVKHSSRKQIAVVVVSFFIFQTLFEWMFYAVNFFSDGYSPLSFIGLYLLARFLRCYAMPFLNKFNKKIYLFNYLLMSLTITFLSFLFLYLGEPRVQNKMFSYINPLVIFSALNLFLFFTKMKIQNKFINYISSSCFAVYLVHNVNPQIVEKFKTIIQYLYYNTSGFLSIFYIILFLLIVFIIGIIIDKARLYFVTHLHSFIIIDK